MRLTQWTDYTLRVLMYCAASQDRPQPVTITEIAEAHGGTVTVDSKLGSGATFTITLPERVPG